MLMSDGGRGFAWLHLRELGKGNRLNLALNVDTVGDYVTLFTRIIRFFEKLNY